MSLGREHALTHPSGWPLAEIQESMTRRPMLFVTPQSLATGCPATTSRTAGGIIRSHAPSPAAMLASTSADTLKARKTSNAPLPPEPAFVERRQSHRLPGLSQRRIGNEPGVFR
jgi:hypothetical protein